MKTRKRFIGLSIAFLGLVLTSSLPLVNKIEIHQAVADNVVIAPISDYWFNSGNPGYDSKQHYYLTAIGGPVGTGTNNAHGTVTFDGVDDFLASEGTKTNPNNIFYDYASSHITVAFDLTIKSYGSGWLFPITFYDGGDIWHFANGHVGFLIDPDNHKLRYADTVGTTGLTDWWYPEICSTTINETITIVVSISKGGNTKIYVNGNATPSYDKASFSSYNASGSDWSGFSLGGFSWRAGDHGLNSNHEAYGYTNCTFKNLKIYDSAFSSSQAVSWSTNKDIYKVQYSISYNLNGGTINSGQINSYTSGTQKYLPTDVTKSGYVFGGWYEDSLFSGSPVTVISPSDEGNKTYYAKWTAASQGAGQLTPAYYYRFTNGSNPGSESNNLAALTKYGTVTVTSGSAVFNGDGALYASGSGVNFSNSLNNFTMGFDFTLTSTSSNWQFPISFGFNDNSWLNFQIAPDSTKLMFSCSGAKQSSQTNAYWGHTVAESLNLNQTYRITLSFNVGGDLRIYLNGSLALSNPVDSNFSTAGNNFNFTIGGNYDATYSTFQNGLKGKIANFDVYTFAANEKESIQDGIYKHIYYDNYSITLNTNEGTYLSGYTAPTSYRTRVGATLPTASQITKAGYSFKGWYTTSTFSGSAYTSVSASSTGNKTFYAKWVDQSVSSDPIASYEFTNSGNPGKDSMNSYNLVNRGASASGGLLTVNGSSAISGSTSSENFMHDYKDFTLSFDMNLHDLGSSEWKIPFSFGNTGTRCGCFNFNPDSPHILRFKLRDGDTYIAGSGTDMFWGSELTYIPEWTWVNITITVKAATSTAKGSLQIYVDGIKVMSKTLPVGYTMPVSHLSFGGYYNGSSVSNGVNAQFRRVKVFNFNATENQVNYYLNNGYDLSSLDTYSITYNVGEHGYVEAPRMALYNETITIKTHPSEDYIVDKVLVNNAEVAATSTNTYKTKITKATTVNVTFVKNVFSLSSNTYGEGTVTFTQGTTPVEKVAKGQQVTVNVAPASGYKTIAFKVNNVVHELVNGKYTISSVTEDINVVASFEEIKPEHTVTFNKNGGSWTDALMEDTLVFTEGVGCSLPGGVDIVKEGYTFEGWYNNALFDGDPVASIGDTVTTNVSLFAKWTPVDYLITYSNLQGGTINDVGYPTGYTYGVGATLPSDVTRAGYQFIGWYDNIECAGEPITTITTTDNGNKILFAGYEKENYTIAYNVNGGTYESGYTPTTSYEYGDEVFLPNADNISLVGYDFAGWYDNPSFEGSPIISITSSEYGNKTLYAKWTNATYQINYIVNGGVFNEEINTSYTYGSEFVLPTASQIDKTGYTFAGWYLDPNFDSEVVTVISEGTFGAQTYYAKYTANVYNIIYKESDGGDFLGVHGTSYPTTYTYDQTVDLDVPTRDGYEFEGYYLTNTFEIESAVYALSKETYTSDIVIYVHWTESGDYSIYYYLNGAEWRNNSFPTSYHYGTGATLPTSTSMSRTGYQFAGWYDNSSFENDAITAVTTTDAGEKTYYAKWDKLTYTVVYYDGENEVHPTSALTEYQIGTQYQLPSLDKAGYEFAGWYEDVDLTLPVTYLTVDDYGNKIYYAKFEVINNTYTLIFDSNDGGAQHHIIVAVDVDAEVNLANYIYETNHYHQIKWVDSENKAYQLSTYTNLVSKGETLVLYAVYEADAYSITYETNGGELNLYPVTSYKYGQELLLPVSEDISKENYIFVGWYINEDLSGERFTKIYAGSDEDITFYAKWEEDNTVVTYSISFNLGGGTILQGNISYYVEGTTTTLPTNVYLSGYTFDGWYDNEDYEGSPAKLIESNESGDKSYYAKWKVDTYKVSVENNDHGTISVSKTNADYNSQITITPTAYYGYKLGNVLVNGVELEPDSSGIYSFLLKSDSYVQATFNKITFLVNIVEPDEDEEDYHGYVESEYDSVDFGEIIEFEITPDKGYKVGEVLINGEDVTELVVNNILRYRANTISDDDLTSERKQLTIEVAFVKANSEQAEGCSNNISSSIYLIIPTMLGITLLIIFRKKEYYKQTSKKDG